MMELRLWDSYRGQTLVHTVRGIIYYYKALKMLAFLDLASEMSIQRGCQALAAAVSRPKEGENHNWDFPSRSHLNTERCGVDILLESNEDAKALMKFTYVVTCQIYGAQKARKDHHAKDILYLMKNYESLQISYVDMVTNGREVEYYSVELQKEVEVYRVRLPGPVKLGEGKPENQNHALIFIGGDALQTIDMNQENYFEEALKM